jgi:hypothetical protein
MTTFEARSGRVVVEFLSEYRHKRTCFDELGVCQTDTHEGISDNNSRWRILSIYEFCILEGCLVAAASNHM